MGVRVAPVVVLLGVVQQRQWQCTPNVSRSAPNANAIGFAPTERRSSPTVVRSTPIDIGGSPNVLGRAPADIDIGLPPGVNPSA